MKLLRDKKELTRFLILYHSALERPNKLSEISEPLGMTEQGVSNYITDLEEEGLMDSTGKSYHPTLNGMEQVRDVLSQLNTFIDEANRRMDLIKYCTAIADENISPGDRVGLYMRDGFLRASSEEKSSNGIAQTSAEAGGGVSVGELHGITEMDLGTIYILRADLEDTEDDIRSRINEINYDLVGVTGEAQYGLARSLVGEPDILFGTIEASINAAERGVDVLLIVSEKDAERIIARIEGLNRERDAEYKVDHRSL